MNNKSQSENTFVNEEVMNLDDFQLAFSELKESQPELEISNQSSSVFFPLTSRSSEILDLQSSQIRHCFDEQDILETLPLTQSILEASKLRNSQQAQTQPKKAPIASKKEETKKPNSGRRQSQQNSKKITGLNEKKNQKNKTASVEKRRPEEAKGRNQKRRSLVQKNYQARSFSPEKGKMSVLSFVLEKVKNKKREKALLPNGTISGSQKSSTGMSSQGSIKSPIALATDSTLVDPNLPRKPSIAKGLPSSADHKGKKIEKKMIHSGSGPKTLIKKDEGPEEKEFVFFVSNRSVDRMHGENLQNQRVPTAGLFTFCPSLKEMQIELPETPNCKNEKREKEETQKSQSIQKNKSNDSLQTILRNRSTRENQRLAASQKKSSILEGSGGRKSAEKNSRETSRNKTSNQTAKPSNRYFLNQKSRSKGPMACNKQKVSFTSNEELADGNLLGVIESKMKTRKEIQLKGYCPILTKNQEYQNLKERKSQIARGNPVYSKSGSPLNKTLFKNSLLEEGKTGKKGQVQGKRESGSISGKLISPKGGASSEQNANFIKSLLEAQNKRKTQTKLQS